MPTARWIPAPAKSAQALLKRIKRGAPMDAVVMAGLLLATTLFWVEVVRFLEDGIWVIHGGAGAFSRWPQPSRHNLTLWVHTAGMCGWILAVVYQLRSKGKGRHVTVGRVSAALLVLSLALSFPPAAASSVPALHAFAGLSLMDVTLLANAVGILVETMLGIYKARVKRIAEHRKHLLTAACFTAAPGLYRALVLALSPSSDHLPGEAGAVFATVWTHELAACLAILVSLGALVSRPLSGHRLALERRGRGEAWERSLSRSMLALGLLAFALYGVWTADLLALRASGREVATFSREDCPGWVHYFHWP